MTAATKSSLLLYFFSLCAAAMIVSHDVRRRTPAPTAHELFVVVNNQLAAFRASDFPRAYRHASIGVHEKFSLLQFENLIRRNYAEMTQRQRIEFGFVQMEGATAVVQVFFFAPDGTMRPFLYTLVAEDGTWRIEGVEPMRTVRLRQTGLQL